MRIKQEVKSKKWTSYSGCRESTELKTGKSHLSVLSTILNVEYLIFFLWVAYNEVSLKPISKMDS